MFFIILLIISAFSIAGASAFFSVYGLAQTFSGAAVAVMFMGTSLEAGKLITASFLYRYWQKISWLLKTYLCLAVFILMIITSVGIFAFLSKGYQEDTLSLKELDKKIEHLVTERDQLQTRKDKMSDSKGLVVESVANITDNTKRWQANTKAQMAKSIVNEDISINERLTTLSTELYALEDKKISTQLHAGPIIYIAQAFGVAIDDATKYIILLLILVFDPLAIALTIGVNVALKHYKLDKANIIETNAEKTTSVIQDNIMPDELINHVTELFNRKQIMDSIRKG